MVNLTTLSTTVWTKFGQEYGGSTPKFGSCPRFHGFLPCGEKTETCGHVDTGNISAYFRQFPVQNQCGQLWTAWTDTR